MLRGMLEPFLRVSNLFSSYVDTLQKIFDRFENILINPIFKKYQNFTLCDL